MATTLSDLHRDLAAYVERARFWSEQKDEKCYAAAHRRINDKLDQLEHYTCAVSR
jgi:hypothetical protein